MLCISMRFLHIHRRRNYLHCCHQFRVIGIKPLQDTGLNHHLEKFYLVRTILYKGVKTFKHKFYEIFLCNVIFKKRPMFEHINEK